MKIVKCEVCGNDFETKTTGKYCSLVCRKVIKSKDNKKFHSLNQKKINEKRKEHFIKNREWYKKRDKERNEKEKLIIKNLNLLNPNRRTKRNLSHLPIEERKKEIKKKYNILRKKKYSNDEIYSLKIRFRSLLNNKIRKGGFIKKISTLEFLGCDWETFKLHIESQFKEGMSWDNRELWDLDHIIPISEGKTFEDIILLSHFTNFQPLWRLDNIKKSNKW